MNPGFAWNHGDVQQDIGEHLGRASSDPGSGHAASTRTTWTDHTNVRPTILALLGLNDDYVHDGRVLVEALEQATPSALAAIARPSQLGDATSSSTRRSAQFAQHAAGLDHRAEHRRRPVRPIEGRSPSSRGAGRARRADQGGAERRRLRRETNSSSQATGWINQAQSLIAQAQALAASS